MSVRLPKVAKLSKSIIRVLGCNPGPKTLQGTNTYIVGSASSRVLIDSGDGNSEEYFTNLKRSLNFDKFRISDLILTHWHPDHIGGVSKFLKDVQTGCRIHKFPRTDAPEAPVSFEILPLEDGQEFKIDDQVTLKVIHTPGHSSDHVILHYLEENSVFSGDCVLGEGTAVFEDLYDYMKSLDVLLALKPTKIYPGHGPVIEDPIPKIEYYIEHRRERESQILEVLKNSERPLTPSELVKIIYKDTPEHLHDAAAVNVSHHLEKLVKENTILRGEEDKNYYFPSK